MDYAHVLTRRFPDTQWNLVDNDYARLEWLSDTPKPSEQELIDLWPEVEAEMQAERQAKEDARLSGLAKLQALGLTVEEVSTVFGVDV
jgi:hypothetical protein